MDKLEEIVIGMVGSITPRTLDISLGEGGASRGNREKCTLGEPHSNLSDFHIFPWKGSQPIIQCASSRPRPASGFANPSSLVVTNFRHSAGGGGPHRAFGFCGVTEGLDCECVGCQ